MLNILINIINMYMKIQTSLLNYFDYHHFRYGKFEVMLAS